MTIRRRRPDDVPACVEILKGTSARDGYPLNPDDLGERFVVRPREIAAWVDVLDGAVVGHVSIQTPDDFLTYQTVRDVTGLAADDVAIVSALFASVDHRGRGVGRRLLDHAAGEAGTAGRRPALDVGKSLTSAIALYEAAGWQRIGEIAFEIRGVAIDSWVYLGPDLGML